MAVAPPASPALGVGVLAPHELSDAKWFTADALPAVPPPISIARQLIDAWLAETLK